MVDLSRDENKVRMLPWRIAAVAAAAVAMLDWACRVWARRSEAA